MARENPDNIYLPPMIKCSNASGEEIPPWGAMLQGTPVSGRVPMSKPNADSIPAAMLAFNGPMAIPAECPAFDGFPAVYGNLPAAYGGTAPANGAEIGTTNGQWYLQTGKTGFKSIGSDASLGVTRCNPFRSNATKTLFHTDTIEFSDTSSAARLYSEFSNIDAPFTVQHNSLMIIAPYRGLHISQVTGGAYDIEASLYAQLADSTENVLVNVFLGQETIQLQFQDFTRTAGFAAQTSQIIDTTSLIGQTISKYRLYINRTGGFQATVSSYVSTTNKYFYYLPMSA